MKRASLIPLFTAIGSIACSPIPPIVTPAAPITDSRFSSLISYMQSEMDHHGIRGGAIAIVENGKLATSAGLGQRYPNGDSPVSSSTEFRVASLSKMVLAATAMKLVEEGKLDLDAPITNYVPLVLAPPFDASKITMHDLLTHTAGIPDFSVTQQCTVGQGQLAAYFGASQMPLWSPPGALWNYSNQGFAVAGWIIETISGQRFEDAVAQRVFGPAGMTSATYDATAAVSAEIADGHSQSGTVLIDAYDCEATRPPGGVIASVVDYAHFAEAMLAGGDSMLTSASVSAMESGYIDTDQHINGVDQWGYGLEVRSGYKGLNVVRHEGSVRGFRASLWMVPDHNFAVVVFYGGDEHAPSYVSERALDLYLGVDGIALADEKTPSTEWQKYTGEYVDPIKFGRVSVSIAGDKLHVAGQNIGAEDIALTQDRGDVFEGKLDGEMGTVTFYPGPNGPAQWLVSRMGVAMRQ